VQASRPQLDLSFPIAFPRCPPAFRGSGPQSWPNYKGPIAKLGRSGLKIGALNSSCKSVKSVSFCPTCPGMPDQPRLAWFNRFAQSTTESPYTLQWATLSPKIAPSCGGPGPPCKTRFLGPIGAHKPNGISIGSAVFPQTTVECPYTLQWDAHSPQKICPFLWGDLNPHPTHGPLGPPKSSTQTASRSVQPFLQGSLVWQTDRQTDRRCYSVSNNRPHLRT